MGGKIKPRQQRRPKGYQPRDFPQQGSPKQERKHKRPDNRKNWENWDNER